MLKYDDNTDLKVCSVLSKNEDENFWFYLDKAQHQHRWSAFSPLLVLSKTSVKQNPRSWSPSE